MHSIFASTTGGLRRARAAILSATVRRDYAQGLCPAELAASRQISLIVAIHDSPDVMARCLASLSHFAGRSQVILVDDGSRLPRTTEVIDAYRRSHGWTVIRHDAPRGHSRACESGARVADRPYLCLLNSDTVVTPWSWRGAVVAFEDAPEIAVAGPTTSDSATVQAHWLASRCRHYWDDSQIFGFARRYTAKGARLPLVDLCEVGGFAFFIRRTIWEQMGGFDPNLRDYGNESELCVRIRRGGWRIVWTRGGYIHHFGSTSYIRLGGAKAYKERHAAGIRYIDQKHGREWRRHHAPVE